ncbi:hypothetical protein T492DRAFT_860130 [Pavlovales sp. CCMP2436]|nr:hypothetical protein T492DRAFT_860130 [Pavlovales sp. CCMP2436]
MAMVSMLASALGAGVGTSRTRELAVRPSAAPRASPLLVGTGRGSVVLLESYNPTTTLASLQTLREWLRATHGAFINDGITLDVRNADGRGVYIDSSRANPGAPLLKVPLAACITEHTVLADTQLGEVMAALVEKGGPGSEVVPVVAFLLRERARGRESAWWQYLESLPWSYVGSEQLCWSERCVAHRLLRALVGCAGSGATARADGSRTEDGHSVS